VTPEFAFGAHAAVVKLSIKFNIFETLHTRMCYSYMSDLDVTLGSDSEKASRFELQAGCRKNNITEI
jgi:hypothetical protein